MESKKKNKKQEEENKRELEEKVEKHNSFGERIPVLEDHIRGMDARIKVLESFHRTKN